MNRAYVLRLAAVVTLLLVGRPVGGLPADLDAVIATSEQFVDRQLDKFTVPDDYPSDFDTARLIQLYDLPPPTFTPGDHLLSHRAEVYDSSVAIIQLVENGRLARAKELADGLRLVQSEDPRGDGRIRTSYYANDLFAPGNTGPSIDEHNAATGNMAWAGIALTRFFEAAVREHFLTRDEAAPYLEAAKGIGGWILDNSRQDDAFGGFSLGRDASNDPIWGTVNARSTEHNVDVYVLASNLELLDPNNAVRDWQGMADHAQQFVQTMYDPTLGLYWTGTEDDGDGAPLINDDPVPADGQTWTALAGIDDPARRAATIRFVSDTLETDPNHLIVTDALGAGLDLLGVRFSTGGDHIQSEMTAGYLIALLVGVAEGWLVPEGSEPSDKWEGEIEEILMNLDLIRTSAPSADPDGIGLVATPWPDGAFNGFEEAGKPPTYLNLRHVASAGWFSLAAQVAKGDPYANPLRAIPEPSTLMLLLFGNLVVGLARSRRMSGRSKAA